MIPKKIHYCWFGGGPKPKLAQKCIASWKTHCPGFEQMEWNEENFPISRYPYAQYCLEQKHWAFLSDFVRLVVVLEQGGIYFDTDVELLKSPDSLLGYEAYFGFENEKTVATGLGFGAEPGHPAVKAMLDVYLALKPDTAGSFPVAACPRRNTQALVGLGLKLDGTRQTVVGAEILPVDFLNPYDDPTGRLRKTGNTISVHWYGKSWISPGAVLRSRLTRPFHYLFGKDCFQWLKR